MSADSAIFQGTQGYTQEGWIRHIVFYNTGIFTTNSPSTSQWTVLPENLDLSWGKISIESTTANVQIENTDVSGNPTELIMIIPRAQPTVKVTALCLINNAGNQEVGICISEGFQGGNKLTFKRMNGQAFATTSTMINPNKTSLYVHGTCKVDLTKYLP